MTQTCIIIGASHAAAQLAPSVRQEGWEGRILVIGDEAHKPYHRPPLSKGFILDQKDAGSLAIKQDALYEKLDVEFMLNTRVESINRSEKSLTLKGGETLSYDKLAICTGSRVRRISLPGAELGGVHYLRDMADGESIKASLDNAKHAVIVGGGYIGLETAASLRKAGLEVTVLEMAPRILARVTAPELSAFYQRVHSEEGVEIKTDTGIESFEANEQGDRVSGVKLNDGTVLPADLIIVGIGVLPNVELAEEAGLAIDNGIVVDEYARTEDPDIVSAGDVTNHPNALYNTRFRLESVPNATDQAKSAAASICGKDKVYASLPWFWSDQYDLKLQIAGMSQGYDRVVVRGDTTEGRSFAAFYLKGDKLLAADCVNRPKEFMATKRLLSTGVHPSDEQLADEDFELKSLF